MRLGRRVEGAQKRRISTTRGLGSIVLLDF
jgi:hypothetical protein